MQAVKKIISSIIDWFLYRLLNDDQKERLSKLFSERQKKLLRNITQHGKRRKQKLYIKQVKDNIYSLGLRTKGLAQLKAVLAETKDSYMKRLVAWELVLYYANLESEAGAREALGYIGDAKTGENDSTQLRRIAIVEAECLLKTNEQAQARKLIKQQLSRETHEDLYLALANLEQAIDKRLALINKVYEQHGLNPITFQSTKNPVYDDLKMKKTKEAIKADVKVSVILPAYNAGEGLRVAVESILSQTWQNLELIIVDDCSTDNTLEIAHEYAEKDQRVIVRQTEQNSGPYVARNIALSIARGEYITVNDADDWSHEQKIEIQANHLRQNEEIIANTSAHARLTEDLYFYRRGTPGRYIFPNMSSIMFRRQTVMEKLGYWDSVRFAADGEFKRRLVRVFGEQAFVDLSSGPLSLPRQAVASLTSSSAFGYNGFFMGARKEFVESFMHYYETTNDLRYPFPLAERLYPVPEPMWPTRAVKKQEERQFDLVIASDFRKGNKEHESFITLLQKIVRHNKDKTIGFVQLYEYDLARPIEVSKNVRNILLKGKAQMLVYGEKINTEKLLIIDYNVLLDEQIYIPKITPEQIAILVRKCTDVEQLANATETLAQSYAKVVNVIPLQDDLQERIVAYGRRKQPFQLADEDWVL